jgi:hypothetical protein
MLTLQNSLRVAALCLALCGLSAAADDAFLYVVHGIPGRDLSPTANPGLPVDVLLNNETCAFRGILFGANDGPLTVPAGTYDVKVSLADTLKPCSNAPLAETDVKLVAGSATTLVAGLNSGTPTIETFVDDLSSVASGETRFLFAHAADAPAIEVKVTEQGTTPPLTRTFNLNPGAHASLTLPRGTYQLEATLAGATKPFINEIVTPPGRGVSLNYFAGLATNFSVRLLTRDVGNVF